MKPVQPKRAVSWAWLLIIWLGLMTAASDALSASVTLQMRGAASKSVAVEELKKMATPTVLRVYEFQSEQEESYVAVPINAILDKVLGPGWRSMDEIEFTCVDGYQPHIPVSQFTTHPGYLAFGRPENVAFTVFSKLHGNTNIDLGPFYLIWDNRNSRVLRGQGADYWPFQITHLKVLRSADVTKDIVPPPGSSSAVLEGFRLFRKTCLACHKMNGVGGSSPGLELNRPVSVTTYFKRDWLMKWIDNSVALRSTSRMPNYMAESGASLEQRHAQIDMIVQYLETMAPAPSNSP